MGEPNLVEGLVMGRSRSGAVLVDWRWVGRIRVSLWCGGVEKALTVPMQTEVRRRLMLTMFVL